VQIATMPAVPARSGRPAMRRDLSPYLTLPAVRAITLAVVLLPGFIVYCRAAGGAGL